MKKKIALLMIAAVLVMSLMTACGHEHTFAPATCTAPPTCTECGYEEGEFLPHSWVDATCTASKTCSVCGGIEGTPLGHTWVDATYEAPKTCSVCGETQGDPLEWTLEAYCNENPDFLGDTYIEDANGYMIVYAKGNELYYDYFTTAGFVVNDEIVSSMEESLDDLTESMQAVISQVEDEAGLESGTVTIVFTYFEDATGNIITTHEYHS